jgi:hypothetical protein
MSSPSPVMDVLYLNTYNQVLAIFTRSSEPPKLESDASAFVGEGLRFFDPSSGEVIIVPPSLIGLSQVPFSPSQLLNPRTLLFSQGPPKTLMPTLGTITLPASPASLPVTIAVSAAPPTTVSVLVLVNDPTQASPIQVPATQIIPPAKSTTVVSISGLASGTYSALAIVEGYTLQMFQIKV